MTSPPVAKQCVVGVILVSQIMIRNGRRTNILNILKTQLKRRR
jgi:hypothetical protein